ncbi:hypothetical protein D8B26_006822 [Coccidioides posadasii str. Silveira]|uniref:uncharacterized protein n=1 Tax=Coccidioides posadasii (strain RMSCC 757 / Silveira) TaxID=443226 RepID=UPI001BF096C4|nr:hypothetical protein D8B26_006822 [Coccidioides posadasii str. Silveira]
MASLSEDDCKIINNHPLNDSLDQLRRSLLDAEHSYSSVSSLDSADDRPEHLCQEAVSQLLPALQGKKVAFNLRLRNSGCDIASEIARLFQRVRNSDFSYTHYRLLVKLIIQKASDYDIWSAILNLITELSRVTPTAPSFPPIFDSRLIMHTSALQQDSEQTQQLVKARVFEEIQGCTYWDVQGFFEKYFEGKNWTDRAQDVYKSIKNQHIGGKWTKLLQCTQDNIQNWLFQLQDELLLKEQRRYYTINIPTELTGGRQQVNLIVKRKSGKPSDTEHDWGDIKVIGELKASNNDGVKRTLYLHTFTICGLFMTAWVFDHSGCYSPGLFNIHEQPEQFIQVIAGYTMMTEEELGLDTFTEQDSNHRFIYVAQEGTEMKLQMKPQPLTRQQAIVCRGTSCYLTKVPYSKDWDHITKFSWTSDRQKPEAELLRLANQREVKGIARLVGHWSITSVKEMRSGMTFIKLYSFRVTPSAVSSFSQSFSQPHSVLSGSFSNHHGLTITESSAEHLKKCKSVHAGPKSK